MIRLTKALSAWGTPEFKDVLKQEMEQLDAAQLPLQQGLSTGSYALGDKLNVMIISVSEQENSVHANAGIFYTGIIAGCNCSDDPTPVDENPEYCEVLVEIDKDTAETQVTLLAE